MKKETLRALKKLVTSFKEKRGIFKEVHANKIYLFPKGSREEILLWLLYSISIDYGVNAIPLFSRLSSLFEKNKSLFRPEYILQLDRKKLREIFRKEIRHRFPNAAAEKWISVSRYLMEKYNGEIEKLFESKDAKKIWQEVRNIKGFGPKLASLFLAFVKRLNLVELKEIEDIPVPVDTHLEKLALRIGIIEKPINREELGKIWNLIAKKLGESWLDLNDALWITGAFLCRKKRCQICDLKEVCKKCILLPEKQTDRAPGGI